MDKKDKKKLCPQCEGNIPYQMAHCPFCGFEQVEKPDDERIEANPKSSLASLYNPPYLAQSIGEVRKEAPSVFKNLSQPTEETVQEEISPEGQLAKKELITILLLSIGGQFMMLGLMLLFFSVDGVVTLQWKSQYWYFYCLFSAPFLLLGLKWLNYFKP